MLKTLIIHTTIAALLVIIPTWAFYTTSTPLSNLILSKMMNDCRPNNNSYSPPKRTKTDHNCGVSNKGKIYITIGPQCSGKTTILKRLFQEKNDVESTTSTGNASSNETERQQQQQQQRQQQIGLDVTIDDQALVYITLPTPIFLNNTCIYDTPAIEKKCEILRDQMIYDKTILTRIIDPCMDELAWVLQRLNNQIDAKFFASRICNYDEDDKKNGSSGKRQPSDRPRTTQDDLVDAVEYVIQAKNGENVLPLTVDLFIVESIFRPRPLSLISRFAGQNHPLCRSSNRNITETSSALESAQNQLLQCAVNPTQYPSTAPLSWGNTNTRPREMVTALDAAEKSKRPVEFIIYGGLEAIDKMPNHMFQNDNDMTFCLPKSSRLTLLKRNINRFVETGRYIPSAAIADAMERVESMVASAVNEANKAGNHQDRPNDAKFRLDFELAKLAGYRLHADRTVSSLSPPQRGGRYNQRSPSGRGNPGRGRGNYHSRGRGRHYDERSRGRGGDERWRSDNRGEDSYSGHRGRGGGSNHYRQGGRGGRHPNQGHQNYQYGRNAY